MGEADRILWAQYLTLPEALAKFPKSWEPRTIQETVWRWLQVNKLHTVAEMIIKPDGNTDHHSGVRPDLWGVDQPSDVSAFWSTGDIDLRHIVFGGDLEAVDAWAPVSTELTRLIGVRIDPESIPFASQEERAESAPDAAQEKRGRSSASWWPMFSEELAIYIHDEGVPAGTGSEGQETVIKAILQRLSDRGIDASRTTMQPVVRQVLERLRSAGK